MIIPSRIINPDVVVADARKVSNVQVADAPPPGWFPPGWFPPPPGGVPPPPGPATTDADASVANATAQMRFILFIFELLSFKGYWKYTPWKFCDVPDGLVTAEIDGADEQPSVVQTIETDPELLLMDGTFA